MRCHIVAFAICLVSQCGSVVVAFGTGNMQLASAIAGIFGITPNNERHAATDEERAIYSPRFMQGNSAPPNHIEREIKDAMTNQLMEGHTERRDRLLLAASHKRALAQELLKASERSDAGKQEDLKLPSSVVNGDKKSDLGCATRFNRQRSKLLIKQAERLEAEAEAQKSLIESVTLSQGDKKDIPMSDCDILKVGPLMFVPEADELRHYIDSDTVGQITGSAFTIYYKKVPKITYFWESIELPVRSLGDSAKCFSFMYNGNEQVFCAASIMARNSWMDAVSETWFCKNMGIKGTLPSIKGAEKEVERQAKFPTPPPEEKKEKKHLVNIEVSMDKDYHGHVKINGKEHHFGASKAPKASKV